MTICLIPFKEDVDPNDENDEVGEQMSGSEDEEEDEGGGRRRKEDGRWKSRMLAGDADEWERRSR